jgi:hypothetical protein
MKSVSRVALLFLLVVFASCTVFGQSMSISGSANSPIENATYGTRVSLRFDPDSIVTGTPLSYEQVDNSARTLADGTHITEKIVTSFFYRDSSGRTRQERQLFGRFSNSPFANLKLVEIRDPVAGVQYLLDPKHHVAYRLPFDATPTEQPSAAVAQTKPVSAASNQPKPERTHEDLGTQMMEGVLVEGHRTTTVFPVGSLDNDRPITRTCEDWTSRDVGTVLFKCSDLLNGSFVYRDTNISRAEPDPALFQVPAGYQIVDGPADGRITLKFQMPQQ